MATKWTKAALQAIGAAVIGGACYMGGKQVPEIPRMNPPKPAISLEKKPVCGELIPCVAGDTLIVPIRRRRAGADSIWAWDTVAVKFDMDVRYKFNPQLR